MPSEHRAVLLLLALALGGQGVRYLLSRPGEAPGAVRVLGEPESPAAHRDSVARHAEPLGPGERVDLDVASARQLERLPRVGPGLARRIVADRTAKGPFGSIAGLDRVPGVGRALLEAIGPHVSFSGRVTVERGTGTAVPSFGGPVGPVVNLNSASPTDLQRLPGIGPAKARAIVAYREAHGPFASIEALAAVPGIGASIIKRINGLAIAE